MWYSQFMLLLLLDTSTSTYNHLADACTCNSYKPTVTSYGNIKCSKCSRSCICWRANSSTLMAWNMKSQKSHVAEWENYLNYFRSSIYLFNTRPSRAVSSTCLHHQNTIKSKYLIHKARLPQHIYKGNGSTGGNSSSHTFWLKAPCIIMNNFNNELLLSSDSPTNCCCW